MKVTYVTSQKERNLVDLMKKFALLMTILSIITNFVFLITQHWEKSCVYV